MLGPTGRAKDTLYLEMIGSHEFSFFPEMPVMAQAPYQIPTWEYGAHRQSDISAIFIY